MTRAGLVTAALLLALATAASEARNYRTRKMAGAGCGLACYRSQGEIS